MFVTTREGASAELPVPTPLWHLIKPAVTSPWTLCRRRHSVHFLRNVVPARSRQDAPAVLALVNAVFAQPTQQAISQALEILEHRYPKWATLLRDAEPDILGYLVFPSDHWRSIRSVNALERVNAEIDRRAKVVGIFPNSVALQSMARLDPQRRPFVHQPHHRRARRLMNCFLPPL